MIIAFGVVFGGSLYVKLDTRFEFFFIRFSMLLLFFKDSEVGV